MEQSDNQSTIICPSCKSENPDISVCLTCGAKIKREQLSVKDLIARPTWLTVIAGFCMLSFMDRVFSILRQKNELVVVVLIISAIVDISIAYGLWQLKKWAWLVVVISCCVTIILLWAAPIMLWLNPSRDSFVLHIGFKSVEVFGDKRSVSMAMMLFLKRAIVGSLLYGWVLKYFYSNRIREIFSDKPVIWRVASNDPVNWPVTRHN